MVKAIGETIPMQKADSGSARYAFGCDRKRAWPAGASRPLSDGRGAGVAISNFPRGHSVGHRYWAELDAVPRNGTGDPMASPSVLERKGPARDSLAAIARRCWRLALRGARSRRRSAIDCLEALRSAEANNEPILTRRHYPGRDAAPVPLRDLDVAGLNPPLSRLASHGALARIAQVNRSHSGWRPTPLRFGPTLLAGAKKIDRDLQLIALASKRLLHCLKPLQQAFRRQLFFGQLLRIVWESSGAAFIAPVHRKWRRNPLQSQKTRLEMAPPSDLPGHAVGQRD
jgi:hypothetical protein